MEIELTKKQAELIAVALEQYSRMLCGQIELSHLTALEMALYRETVRDTEFWERRDSIDFLLKQVKRTVFPQLRDNESYGIGKFKEADLGYEMYKMILLHFENEKKAKEGGNYKTNVHSYEPLKLTNEPFIKIR